MSVIFGAEVEEGWDGNTPEGREIEVAGFTISGVSVREQRMERMGERKSSFRNCFLTLLSGQQASQSVSQSAIHMEKRTLFSFLWAHNDNGKDVTLSTHHVPGWLAGWSSSASCVVVVLLLLSSLGGSSG